MGSYLLAACDNIQKGHYISPKQLTNWLVTLFIMSHTCDNYLTQWLLISQRASNSLTQYEGCSWQFIDALKLSQHFKVPLGGEPLNDSLDVTSNTQHTWQRWNWQPVLLLEASSPFPNSCLHVCSLHFSPASGSCWKHGEGGTVLLCNRAVQDCSTSMSSGLQENQRADMAVN